MGYFIGALGRAGVAVLYEEGVELPSDLHGIAYIPIDPQGRWKDRLRKEVEAARLLAN
jgi:predicted nucleotide-binding protein